MALDGRRRLLALRLLAEHDRIGDGFLVDVFVETDPARQAAAANDMVVEIAGGAERDDDTFLGDPERVRLGLEILFEALHSPAGSVTVAMAVGGDVTAVAPALDLDEPQRRFALRSAFRVLDMEGCQLRVRSAGDETRVEVRLGPRKKGT